MASLTNEQTAEIKKSVDRLAQALNEAGGIALTAAEAIAVLEVDSVEHALMLQFIRGIDPADPVPADMAFASEVEAYHEQLAGEPLEASTPELGDDQPMEQEQAPAPESPVDEAPPAFEEDFTREQAPLEYDPAEQSPYDELYDSMEPQSAIDPAELEEYLNAPASPESATEAPSQASSPASVSEPAERPSLEELKKMETDQLADELSKRVEAELEIIEQHSPRNSYGERSFLATLKKNYLAEGKTTITVGELKDLVRDAYERETGALPEDSTLANLLKYYTDNDLSEDHHEVRIFDIVNYHHTFSREAWPWYNEQLKESTEKSLERDPESRGNPQVGQAGEQQEGAAQHENQRPGQPQAPGGGGGPALIDVGGLMSGTAEIIREFKPYARGARDETKAAISKLSELTAQAARKTSDVAPVVASKLSQKAGSIMSHSVNGASELSSKAVTKLSEYRDNQRSNQREQVSRIKEVAKQTESVQRSFDKYKQLKLSGGDSDAQLIRANRAMTKASKMLDELGHMNMAKKLMLPSQAKGMLEDTQRQIGKLEKALNAESKDKSPLMKKLSEGLKELAQKLAEVIMKLFPSRGRTASPAPGG